MPAESAHRRHAFAGDPRRSAGTAENRTTARRAAAIARNPWPPWTETAAPEHWKILFPQPLLLWHTTRFPAKRAAPPVPHPAGSQNGSADRSLVSSVLRAAR